MCNFTKALASEEFIEWKVVIKKEDGYYSAAMGFKYPNGPVPEVTEQHRLTTYFRNDILTSGSANISAMHGRTAVFRYEHDAGRLACALNAWRNQYEEDAVVVKAKVMCDLLEGTYGDTPVVAGKEIYFKES